MRTQGLVVLKPLLLIGIMMFSPLGCQTGLADQSQGEMREISNDQLQQIANKKFGEGITAGASVMLIGVYCNLILDDLLSKEEAQKHINKTYKVTTKGMLDIGIINNNLRKNQWCDLLVEER